MCKDGVVWCMCCVCTCKDGACKDGACKDGACKERGVGDGLGTRLLCVQRGVVLTNLTGWVKSILDELLASSISSSSSSSRVVSDRMRLAGENIFASSFLSLNHPRLVVIS